MGRLAALKLKLQAMLLEMKQISTTMGVMAYDADEISEGIQVWKIDEAGERVKADDGVYKDSEDTEYTVQDDHIVSIRRKENMEAVIEMEEEAPAEPEAPVEPEVTEEQVEEIITEHIQPETEPVEETVEQEEDNPQEVQVEEIEEEARSLEDFKTYRSELDAANDRIRELEDRIATLTSRVEAFGMKPAAPSVADEFKNRNRITGDDKIERLSRLMGR